MSDKFDELDAVLEEESWEFLMITYIPLAVAVQKLVLSRVAPEEIKRRLVQKLGAHREALAMRCELAARHLGRSK
jgi:hypothetical protein